MTNLLSTESQDMKQKRNALIALVLELYRVLMGAGLMLFVPQECNNTSCSLGDNLNRNDTFSIICLSFNLFTAFTFLVLYGVEFKRESKLISYLEVNKNKPMDCKSVEVELEKLHISYKNIIWDMDYYYKISGYFSFFVFLTNTVLSGISIFDRYLDETTITVLITNILFMGMKIYEVLTIVYTDKNVFLSAFLTKRVQYNDVDPDKLNKIKDGFLFETVPPPPVAKNRLLEQDIAEPKLLENSASEESIVSSEASTVVRDISQKSIDIKDLGYIV